MADLSNILSGILNVARLVAPVAGPAGTGAVALATAVQNLLQDARPLATPSDQAEIDQVLRDLQARVNAHADATIAGLRGTPNP